jgi:hypothetical protein
MKLKPSSSLTFLSGEKSCKHNQLNLIKNKK